MAAPPEKARRRPTAALNPPVTGFSKAFDNFVRDDSEDIEGLLAYALYKRTVRDQCRQGVAVDGKVRNLNYKTIRYPGHCAKFRTMIDLGLCSSEAIDVDGSPVKPRRVLGELLAHVPVQVLEVGGADALRLLHGCALNAYFQGNVQRPSPSRAQVG